jgi:4-hydroxy-4-methyl-2-oxoglutarate aldolase
MTQVTVVARADLEKLKAVDSCTISNAIESLDVRPRNDDFLSGGIQCQFPKFPPLGGYAPTAPIRSASPPMSRRCYYHRGTAGAVRHVPAVEALGFQWYLRRTSASHSYAHIIEFGEPLDIDGLQILSGDLLHGDLHGAIIFPLAIPSEIPETASRICREERKLNEFCGFAHFSLQELSQPIQGMSPNCDLPWRRS